ncbi:GDSL-type esterase/lipase family protein [Streptomyces alkaliterrae]|uniref:SGNH hydrolase-type esterase domain-containing protein n=1 Tax=Streptomyces alkaliterrae TaxID=2213162 RepID=A0A5P0YNQ5_9ACTN|nr:GDSL-type esterase/lipase family protein [Streptomyces alkaliterrae]MBB1260310.1 hypothetical protein [Streptomyces alkaliterrae]MQS01983.1 hypothetical protein [Streptomyces alkaliterrae]
MRILCVGDSMTIGGAGDHTWRYRLWRHLRAGGGAAGAVTMVGPRHALHEGSTDYGDPAFPHEARAHLAGWGEGWLHHSTVIGDAVRDHRPDTLLISLGLIDLGFYTNAEQTIGNVRRFFTEARAAAPALRAVLLPVIPNVRAALDEPFAAQCARFNELLAATVDELDTPASPLVLAPQPADWSLDRDTHDGTHPSAAGEHRLAAAFADTLHAAWSIGAPYPLAEHTATPQPA